MITRKKYSDLTADDVESIILNNYDDIYKYCYWKVKNHSDAEDLTQETFLRFVQTLSDYSEQGKPKALLYTIARNLCINWYKQARPLPLSEIEELSSVKTESDQLETRFALEQYVKELPSGQQEILLLRYGQELQVNEISQILNISRFSVMYRIRTATKTLNKKLRKGGFTC